jgi:DNA-binding NarL/FixJ family response regulator
MSLKLFLVDDSTRFLGAARALLEREGFTVIGVASTIADALARYDELDPDVTLVDIDLGDESGLELVRRLAEASSQRNLRAILISAPRSLADQSRRCSQLRAVERLPKAASETRGISGRPELVDGHLRLRVSAT